MKNSMTIIKVYFEQIYREEQECIPVGCVLSAAVAILGGCLPRGCLPMGMSAQGGVCPGDCLPRGCLPRRVFA